MASCKCSSLALQSVARRAFSALAHPAAPHIAIRTGPNHYYAVPPILSHSQRSSGFEPLLSFRKSCVLLPEGRRQKCHFPSRTRICADLRVIGFSTASSDSEYQEIQELAAPSEVVSGFEYLKGGRYCVLVTGHASDYTQKLYGGYGQMFINLLGDPHETWDVYAVVDGQFPTEEELKQYDGFVLTGSRHDAHGSEDWIAKLCDLLQSLHKKKHKTLGVCFGHQILSRALGGKTGRADVGWDAGLRKIETTGALATKSYAAGVPSTFKVLTIHRDQVQEVPPSGELLGFSERTGIEMFAVGDHVLGIQGHPEFTEDVLKDLIDSRLEAGVLKEEEAEAARSTLKSGQADQDALVRLCKGFLKRRTS